MVLGLAISLAGCAASSDDIPEGVKVVKGNASFGSQCPYGTFSPPAPTRLEAWDCPIQKDLELWQAPQTLILQADCKKKTIIVRTPDKKLDSAWEVMPDGAFYFTVEPGSIGLVSDGAGTSNCVTYTTVDVWGNLDCKDRDRINISAEAIWWPGKGKRPTGLAAASTSLAPECKLPSSCYFHTQGAIHQCQ